MVDHSVYVKIINIYKIIHLHMYIYINIYIRDVYIYICIYTHTGYISGTTHFTSGVQIEDVKLSRKVLYFAIDITICI